MNKVIWISRPWYFPYIGFCPNEKAWNKELAKFGNIQEKYPSKFGHCTILKNNDHNNDKLCCIITISEKIDDRSIDTVAGLMTHEAMHCYQSAMDQIGETRPSIEFEAYSVQTIVEGLMKAYIDTRRPKWKTK